MAEVLQKIIAASGLASRRAAQEMIKKGLAKINGEVAQLGDRADAQRDQISVNGRPLSKAAGKIYLKLNKPIGYTCTNRKFAKEKNIFDLVDVPEKLFAVGRLDKDSRGLILLTNDGELNQRLTHPRFGHEKVYKVKVKGELKDDGALAQRLTTGVDIKGEDGVVRAKRAEYLQNGIFVITLSEGRKRQIRRMFAALDLTVNDLIRTAIGPLKLGPMKEGGWERLSEPEIMELKKSKNTKPRPKRNNNLRLKK